jgi:hypothetical protein
VDDHCVLLGSTQPSNTKQKCDAKRPCTACIMTKTVSECVYHSERRPQTDGTYFSHWADGRLLPGGSGSAEIRTAAPSHPLIDGVSGAKLDRIPSTSSDASWAVTNEPAAQHVFGTDQVPHGELVLVRGDPLEQRAPLDTSKATFTIPSSFLPTIPPEPWIPLSFLGEEKLQVQVSDTAATDLDMKSCVLEQESIGHELTLRALVGYGLCFAYPSSGFITAAKNWTH